MRGATQPDREEFQKLLSAAYLLQDHSDSLRHETMRQKQGKERACQHAEVMSKVLALGTLFDLEQLNFEAAARSEEHTSELQSHVNLVCRLLLEKKNSHNHRHG